MRIGSRLVPYWQAGAAYAPYGAGYFTSAGLLAWAFQPSAGLDTAHGFEVYGGPGTFDGGGFDGGGGGGD